MGGWVGSAVKNPPVHSHQHADRHKENGGALLSEQAQDGAEPEPGPRLLLLPQLPSQISGCSSNRGVYIQDEELHALDVELRPGHLQHLDILQAGCYPTDFNIH